MILKDTHHIAHINVYNSLIALCKMRYTFTTFTPMITDRRKMIILIIFPRTFILCMYGKLLENEAYAMVHRYMMS